MSHILLWEFLKKHAKWDNNTALINILLLTVDQMTLCKEKRFIWKIVVVNFTRQCHCFGFYMVGVGGVVRFVFYILIPSLILLVFWSVSLLFGFTVNTHQSAVSAEVFLWCSWCVFPVSHPAGIASSPMRFRTWDAVKKRKWGYFFFVCCK